MEKRLYTRIHIYYQGHHTAYQLFLVLRHNERYNYNNIWINLYAQPPGDSFHKAAFELPLATNEKWLATGMDDIYEHRIKLTDPQYLKAGFIILRWNRS
jgi:gliding motility-associated lipoprotein GldH